MEKIDLKKEFKNLYNPSAKQTVIVEVPPMNYLMVDGSGDPNTSLEAKDAIEALFPVSYTLKFMVKKNKQIDYSVMPLEGLWWTDDMSKFDINNKDIWKFTYMIMQPEYIDTEMVNEALIATAKKKNLLALKKMRFAAFNEGWAAQILHIGPFADEGSSINKLHTLIKEQGGSFNGLIQKHHEIYLSDYRKTTPEKLRTVIRQPFVK